MASEPTDRWIGVLLQGRYRIVAHLAEGGMGVVYKGERVGLDRPVAIKFLHSFASEDAEALRRFEIEAKAAARINHPNCVSVIDFGREKREPYIVMDFVEGRTLRKIVDEGPMQIPRALAIARGILAGLAHAHGHQIIHRDIKPENVLVSADAMGEHVHITDFGLAKLAGTATVTAEVAIGTPSYMSPEQTMGHRADARSDVYGAGIVLFELLTGVKPFTSKSPFDTMKAHRDKPIPAFADVAPDRDVPAAVEAVVRKALAKSPDDRYPTAIELASALTNATSTSKHDSTGALLAEATARPKWIVVAALAAVAAVGVIIFVATRSTPATVAVTVDASVASPVVVAGSASGASSPEVAAAIELARTKPVAAIAALDALRITNPKDARIVYTLGTLNVERSWWQPAVQDYAEAVRLDPAYRTDGRLVRDVVQALQSDKAVEEATYLLTTVLRDAAIEELAAAERGGSPQLRARAAKIRERIAPR